MVKVVGFDETVRKRVTCRHCAAILEYVPQDVTTENVSDYGGGVDTYRYITCPNCVKKVYVKGQ